MPQKIEAAYTGDRTLPYSDGIPETPNKFLGPVHDATKKPTKRQLKQSGHKLLASSAAMSLQRTKHPLLKKVRFKEVEFFEEDDHLIARCQRWLVVYSQFFEGTYSIDEAEGRYLVKFSREADARTFWLQCENNERLFNGGLDALIDV